MGPQVAYFMPQILIEHGPARARHRRPGRRLPRRQPVRAAGPRPGLRLVGDLGRPGHHRHLRGEALRARRLDARRAVDALPLQGPVPGDGDPHAGEQHHAERRATPRRPRPTRSRRSAPCTASSTSAAPSTAQPVAFARQRSTYFHEADSARAFADLNRPVEGAERRGLPAGRCHKINFTFNWFYADDRDIGYFNSGDNPVRAAGADPDFPNWGTGEYDWQGWETTFKTADVHALRGAPAGGQPGLHHLLEQQAGARLRRRRRPVGLRPASTARSRSTSRSSQRIAGAGKMSLPEADRLDGGRRHRRPARRRRCCRCCSRSSGTPSDPQLAAAVAHAPGLGRLGRPPDRPRPGRPVRRTRTRSRSWTPGGRELLEAEFKPEMGAAFFDAVHGVLAFDNEPNNHGQHLGSAYQDGWWGYVSKDLRRVLGQSVSGRLLAHVLRRRLADAPAATRCARRSRTRSPCRRARSTTRTPSTAGTQRVAQCPAGKSDQWCFDSVRFRPIGAVTVPHDPLDQPPDLPAGRRDPGPPRRAATPRPKGATPAAGSARAGLPGLRARRTASTARRSRSARATRPCRARTT